MLIDSIRLEIELKSPKNMPAEEEFDELRGYLIRWAEDVRTENKLISDNPSIAERLIFYWHVGKYELYCATIAKIDAWWFRLKYRR